MTNLVHENNDAGFGVLSANERYAVTAQAAEISRVEITPASMLASEHSISPERKKLFDLGQLALTGREMDILLAQGEL